MCQSSLKTWTTNPPELYLSGLALSKVIDYIAQNQERVISFPLWLKVMENGEVKRHVMDESQSLIITNG